MEKGAKTMFTLVEENRCHAVIKVFGVGGGGGNAVNTMIEEGLTGVEFIAANTDAQALARSLAPLKLQLGARLTKGLGAGANPDIGRQAATEDRELLREALSGADMVFITAGFGGGTGTGAGPVVAEAAREVGALTVAVVTRPFQFEGATRRRQAEGGLKDLRAIVDTLIVIPNEKLLLIAGKEMRFVDAFRKADEVLFQAVRGISELVTRPGYINLDFADVKTIMTGMGIALMGTGSASGQNRAVAAAEKAISSPLLEDVSIRGAVALLERGPRSGEPRPAGGRRRGEHHLRDRRRRDARGGAEGDGHRDRVRAGSSGGQPLERSAPHHQAGREGGPGKAGLPPGRTAETPRADRGAVGHRQGGRT